MQSLGSGVIVESIIFPAVIHTLEFCTMLLSTLMRDAYLPSRIELAFGYVEALEITIRKFSHFLGREATVADFSESTIAAFLMDYRKSWSARSTNNRRSHLITLWTAAFDAGHTDRMPLTRRLRKLKTNPDRPG